ncbi:unnamed protein product, partial [Ectocarpus sp. 12 AP-2014]
MLLWFTLCYPIPVCRTSASAASHPTSLRPAFSRLTHTTMRSAVVLLGFLLASAQAFYIPARARPALNSQPSSFLGQTAAVAPRAAPSARRAILVASLEDIEKKLIADEKAKA